jgi:type I thyroxine 5'-deiodinase
MYHEQVQFLSIYIREAHPRDGWWLGGGLMGKMVKKGIPKTATDIYDPKTIEERRAIAEQCEESLQYGIRTYVDEMDDLVSKAYAAKPTRLYLIGVDGHVVYAGGLGPYGFSPGALKSAIETYLAEIGGLEISHSVASD